MVVSSSRRHYMRALLRSLFPALALLLISQAALAQHSHFKGQHIEPAYEGWEQNQDGSYNFLFGYHNENWEEQPDIPVGDSNYFSPGEADRGQPTRFLPRRNRFTFKVRVPEDWGDKELIWTLTHNGVTRKAYATLARDYVVDANVIASETGSLGAGTSSPESRANVAPVVTVQGKKVRGKMVKTAKVGEPVVIRTHVQDDGLPEKRASASTPERALARAFRAPARITVGKTNGLFLSWNVFRGEGKVSFDPPQVKPWEDTRTSASSPWGALWTPPSVPEDGMYEVAVTFDQAGTYLLWARADDGGLYHDQYVTVKVSD